MELVCFAKFYKFIDFLKLSFPLLTKWSQLQLIKSDLYIDNLYAYILESPVCEVRELLLIIDSGYFSLNYIEKKISQIIEADKRDSNEVIQLLYIFEDFMLKHFPKLYSTNEHLCGNVGKYNTGSSKFLFQ